MKTIIAVTALVASVASASAMTSPTGELERYAPAEKVAQLTDAQVLSALNVINGGDTESEKRAFIRSIVK